jgi:ribonuclease/clavin/mitogillin
VRGWAVLYFRYHNTNCFIVRSSTSQKLLAIDAGWPGTLFEYARCLKTIECNLENVAWVVLTHFHMDHAGLVGEFVERGVTCFALEGQIESIDAMEKTIEKNDKTYRRIDKTKLRQIKSA